MGLRKGWKAAISPREDARTYYDEMRHMLASACG
jgi:hypothetical protein